MWLVDTNALLDIFTDDPNWKHASLAAVSRSAPAGIAVNPIIYAELAPAFASEDELLAGLSNQRVELLQLPFACAWLAAQAVTAYRARGGTRQSILPDFFIGAHAQTSGMGVITRDPARFRTCFPSVPLQIPS